MRRAGCALDARRCGTAHASASARAGRRTSRCAGRHSHEHWRVRDSEAAMSLEEAWSVAAWQVKVYHSAVARGQGGVCSSWSTRVRCSTSVDHSAVKAPTLAAGSGQCGSSETRSCCKLITTPRAGPVPDRRAPSEGPATGSLRFSPSCPGPGGRRGAACSGRRTGTSLATWGTTSPGPPELTGPGHPGRGVRDLAGPASGCSTVTTVPSPRSVRRKPEDSPT